MFKKYSSIENHYRDRFIRKIKEAEIPGTLYVVTEKIHGTNMSFVSDGVDVHVAKRSGIIPSEELSAFFRADFALDKYHWAVLNTFHQLRQDLPSLKSIQIFGEWAGGGSGGFPRIQKEVFYGTDLNFFVFDVAYQTESDEVGFIPHLDLLRYTRGFYRAPVIKITDDLDDALETENAFNSYVPAMLGIECDNENIAEGVVIKPNHTQFLSCGSRVIIKSKNEKFTEKKAKKPKEKVEYSSTVEGVLRVIPDYVTEGRLANVISKIGPGLKPNAYIGPMAKDILEDLEKDLDDSCIVLSKEDRKIIQKKAAGIVAPFVLKHV